MAPLHEQRIPILSDFIEMSTPKPYDRQIPFFHPAQFVDYIKNNFYLYSNVLHSFLLCVAFILLLAWDSMHLSFTHERFQNYLLQGPDHSRTILLAPVFLQKQTSEERYLQKRSPYNGAL